MPQLYKKGGGAGSDTTAIHDNESAEISAVTEKGTPVASDLVFIEDSADANSKKRVQAGNLPGGVAASAGAVVVNAQKASSGTINVGQVVYVASWKAGAGIVEVELAKADAQATLAGTGICSATITNSVTGKFVMFGAITGFDTSSFSEGAPVYVSAATAGAITAVKPTGTNFIQKIGDVARSHNNQGVIFVNGPGRSNDLPNIALDNIWRGDSSGVATATSFATVSQAEAEAGTATTLRGWTAERVKQAIAALGSSDTNALRPAVGIPVAMLWSTQSNVPEIVQLGTTNKKIVGAFDDTVEESKDGIFLVPPDIAAGTVTLYAIVSPKSGALSKTVGLRFKERQVADGAAWDGGYTSRDSGNKAITDSLFNISIITWSFTHSWTGGRPIYFAISRYGTGGTNLVGDMYWHHFEVLIPRA
jgi:hypothetical protein